MRFEGIKKVLDGHFINRYDITYTTEDNRTKVYEIIRELLFSHRASGGRRGIMCNFIYMRLI